MVQSHYLSIWGTDRAAKDTTPPTDVGPPLLASEEGNLIFKYNI